ncbi:PucR family transcriptional regulator [Rhodococcus sp. ACT016]|uniref:PucR family transcriptional regulator n=1 Tax=Rhodococcus sp. ACT016 TaxID=3134808 RepID=UPI003D2B227A
MTSPAARTGLRSVLDDLGTLLEVVAGEPDLDEALGGLAIHDPDGGTEIPLRGLVLVVGVRDASELVPVLEHLAQSGVAAVIVRGPWRDDPRVADAVRSSGIAVLALAPGISWVQLVALLRSVLEPGSVGGTTYTLAGAPAGDLFAFANAVSALLDAPITIEDRSSRVLAFSGKQDESDPARVATVLDRQVPESYLRMLEERGVFDRLRRSDDPVWVERMTPEQQLARVAVAVRAGDEYLGSMWAVVAEPLSPDRERAFRESSKLVALHMLRQRAGSDEERRVRADLVATVLEGGAGVRDALARLGLGAGPALVLALGLRSTRDVRSAGRAARLERLTDALAVHLGAMHGSSAVALVNGIGYAVLASRPSEPDPERYARAVAAGFLDRIGIGTDAVIGVGRIVSRPIDITRSRHDAARALGVLQTGRVAEAVATYSDVYVDVVLSAVAADAAAEGLDPLGPIGELAEHGPSFVDTLEAWLDAFGDVGTAAAAQHVHPNTFRYRLRRVRSLLGLDLDDPDVRFRLMVHLRLAKSSGPAAD